MRKSYTPSLLLTALAMILSAGAPLTALAAGGAGGKGAGLASGAGSAGTTNTTTAGGGGGVGTLENFSGTVGGSGGGGAGSTGGDGGQSLILVAVGCCAVATSPNGGAGTGGATPGASGGNGADGSDITRTTGGGGGGGAHGTVLTTSTTDTGTTGGNGGNGGIGGFTMGGGGGGAAGYGAVIDGSGLSYTNTGTVAGGTGGAGGDASHFGGGNGNGGNGGDGGIGVYFTGSSTLNNSGSITGGAGGAGGSAVLAGGRNGAAGTDGAGVIGSNLTIVNSGSIAGGGTANAITFNGGTNSLSLGTSGTISGNIGNNGSGSLLLNQTGNSATLSSAITGNGSVEVKTGAYILTLNGNNTYTGTTTVSNGTLILNGSNSGGGIATVSGGTLEVGDTTHTGATLSSNVTVSSSGTLRGHGTITGSVANSGSFRPGGSIGNLTVNGGVTFNSGSSFDVDVSPSAASRLNVTGASGTATIGNNVGFNVIAENGTYGISTQYTVLNAAGGVTGTFSTVNSNLAFLTPSLSYDANNVYLTLVRNGTYFSDIAATTNQRSVAGALNAIYAAGSSGDMQSQINTLLGLSASQAKAAYDSLSGPSLNNFNDAQLGFTDGFADIISNRIDSVAGGNFAMVGAPIRLAAADTTISDVTPDYGFRPAANRGAWIQAYGNNGHILSDGNAPAYDLNGGGLATGVDRPLENGWRVGAAFAYGQQNFSTNSAAGTADGLAVAAYGHYAEGPWSVKLLASAGQTYNHSERSVVLGATSRTASANFDGTQQSLYAESSYTMTVREVDVQPVAALAYTHLYNSDYTETGAGALNLSVAGQGRDSLRSYFGARFLRRAGDLRIEPRLIWVHQFGNISSAALAASFAGSPTNAFATKGVDDSREGAQLGLRLAKSRAEKQQIFYLDMSGEASNRRTNATLAIGFQQRW